MKKEVSPWIAVVGILLTLTVILLVYWHGLVGGGKPTMAQKPPGGAGGEEGGAAVEPSGPAVTTLAGRVQPGYLDGPAAEALFNGPSGLAVGADGTVLVSDSRNNCIRKITTDGKVSTLAGSSSEGFSDGTGEKARFSAPAAIALAPDGTLFVSDTGNHRIRCVAKAGVVSTYAGSDTPRDDTGRAVGGYRDGAAPQAQFRYPVGLAVDAAGTVYVADTGNHCVRSVSAAGQVTTIATNGGQMEAPTELALVGDRLWAADTGSGALWVGPHQGPLQRLQVAGKSPKAPAGLAAGGAGLYVADSAGHCLLWFASDRFSRIAGKAGAAGYADGRGAMASFWTPAALALGPGGKVYIADFGNNCIRELTPESHPEEGH